VYPLQPSARPTPDARLILYEWIPATNHFRLDGAIQEILGYDASNLRSDLSAWSELVHPDDIVAFAAEIQHVVKAGGVFRLRYRVRHRNGSYVPVEGVGQFVREVSSGPARMVGFVTEISARLQAELEVQRLANFARFNPNPVLELTESGEVTFANDAAHQMMRALGRTDLRSILPPTTEAQLRECLESGRPVLRVEVEIELRSFSWSFFPVPGENIVHCYGGDISERKRFEAEFRHAQKMQALGQLAGGIAHDFNNLLTVVGVHASVMAESPVLSGPLLESVREIRATTERAARLTRQLLTFSRKQPMQIAVLDLRAVLQNMATLLTRLLGEHIRIDFDLGAAAQFVKADVGMMEQIMMNLAVNARDAMPHGGRLTIALREVEGIAGPEARPGAVRWTIADNGIGIPADVLGRIFDPFFTTKSPGRGTGLGLATVHSIVEQHGGQITVTSEEGTGTTFTIVLPKSEPAVLAVENPTLPSTLAGSETILVVEDEPMVRSLVEHTIARAGYRVFTAGDATEAFAVWQQQRSTITLLLTDLILPGTLSGRQIAERLLADEPDLKVVYMTGYSPDAVGNNPLLREGVNFISKPFTPAALLRTLRTCLTTSASRSPFAVAE
jgi:two-component system, cell cycle sensor histidine kinase and response regulator CckA